ncbi:ABC transporter substrate-binding protein [Marinobacterium arenosum]|uniref:ABC transporter substrate-binding protein n=1 Tax=Marinobacterium arenosum TaxID=2862496 RepID=UPI001C968F0E|nr:ABC transporter substrate-binding protein [Marinobacterium arenosum]MBY4676172.1 ABC transporter substrate-binding protein [Marinobacterium arenosum]
MKPTTHRILAAAGLAAALSTSQAYAQDTLYFAAYGGSSEKAFKEDILPAFEKKHNVRVEYVAGNSTTTLSRLQAQRNNPEIDVALIDEGPIAQATGMGLCRQLPAELFDQVHKVARLNKDQAVSIGLVATGLAYNKEYFAAQGWDAPSSWRDLEDSKYKARLSIPPITNGYGLISLIMAARLHGGGETNIEPGFEVMSDKIRDNVLVFEPSSGKMSELFQNGEIVLSVWGSGRVKALADSGFPVEFAYPEEGAVALGVSACAVKGTDQPELSLALINYLLSPEVQKILAEQKGWAPTNKSVQLDEALAATLPNGENVQRMISLDWDTVNEQRARWTKRWNREVE